MRLKGARKTVLVILNICILQFGFFGSTGIINKHGLILSSEVIFDGTTGNIVSNPSSKIGDLEDTAYTFTEADIIDDYGMTVDDDVTVVIIDDGLTVDEWEALEDNTIASVDILGVLTADDNEDLVYIDSTSHEDVDLLDDVNHGHGFSVTSVLAPIVNGVEVIFVDMHTTVAYGTDDDYGAHIENDNLWDWIYDNIDSKDIDIVSISWGTLCLAQCTSLSWYYQGNIEDTISDIRDSGVVMISATGNRNAFDDNGYSIPASLGDFYAVGSIDHEDRGTGGDPDYYSEQGERTGEAPGTGLENSEYTQGSSWYDTCYWWDYLHTVNWIMPGNGVPILDSSDLDSWIYGFGTSFSAPYFAGLVAMAFTRYHAGIGDSTDPSISEIEDFIDYGTSESCDQKRGKGHVDFYLVLSRAYYLGAIAS